MSARKKKVESHYRDKEDRSNRAWFEKPISKLQPRLKKLDRRFKCGTREREEGIRFGKRVEKWLKARLFGREKEKIGSICVVIHKPNGFWNRTLRSARLPLSLLSCVSLFSETSDKRNTDPLEAGCARQMKRKRCSQVLWTKGRSLRVN